MWYGSDGGNPLFCLPLRLVWSGDVGQCGTVAQRLTPGMSLPQKRPGWRRCWPAQSGEICEICDMPGGRLSAAACLKSACRLAQGRS